MCVRVCVSVCEGHSYSLTVGEPLQRQSRGTENESRYMYVSLYACIYVYICIYVCMCVCIYMYIYMCMCVCVSVCEEQSYSLTVGEPLQRQSRGTGNESRCVCVFLRL
jgi:hypothetical protein